MIGVETNTKAAREDDPESDWHGYHMAEIGDLEVFPAPISIRTIKAAIPAWRYWLSPVRSSPVPREHMKALNSLINSARGV
jgi:hypothetical protein